MSVWNYVVTAQKPTAVTHSRVGNFTSPHELNLILAKCTRIEIHLYTPQGLETLLDVPLYGRITTLELFRPRGEAQDLLFIATERHKFCVLQWDSESSGLITREMGDVNDCIGRRPDNVQIGIVDPDCRLIGFHLYDGLFKVIPFDNKGQLKQAYNIRLRELHVLDIKFLHGCAKPTIAVLYQDNEDARHVKTYEVSLKENFIKGKLLLNYVDNGADLLIPVPSPLCGVLVVGVERIFYWNEYAFEEMLKRPSIIKAYGIVDADGSRYLLGDHAGLIHMLVISHDKEKVTDLKLELLGETSIASTISYLGEAVVFVGSIYGDSQLIKINLQPGANGSFVEILESYVNLGPIVDFCVVDLERQGQGQVVTCSGAYKNGSLRVVRSGINIKEQASVELEGVKGMWSLKSLTDEASDTFLVVSFISETRILAMNEKDELEETEIGGFLSEVQTIFCHDAVCNQHVQVTSNSVRLVSSTTRALQTKWDAPAGFTINVATANASQVLLATGDGHLFYLQIEDGTLTEVQHVVLENEISCLDINPIGDSPNHSQLAAVGMWTEISVRILVLPELTLFTKEQLGGEIIPRSVLLCAFHGVSYLLCALGDGHLLSFRLDVSNGELRDRRKVLLGSQPITLRTFSSKNGTCVFAASDRPAVLYSCNNKKLIYSSVNLKEVSHMCPFNTASFPECLAIAREDRLAIGTIDDIQKLHIRTIPVEGRPHRICHQPQTHTFAICSLKNHPNAGNREMDFVCLLDDQTFKVFSAYLLDANEYGCSILSCSFATNQSFYYCVGTAYAFSGKCDSTKGRILVFLVKDQSLVFISEKKTEGAVYSLNAFKGKLLAAINQNIVLYKWMRWDDATHELLLECRHQGRILARFVQTRGDFIVVGDLMKSISFLVYKHEEGEIEERAWDHGTYWMTAVGILDDDTYLGAEDYFNLFTVKRSSEGATDEERSLMDVVGEYHLGEYVSRFHHGSLVMKLHDSEIDQIPTMIFGTLNGVIGVIASLPQELYAVLEKLQTRLRKVVKGVGGLSHDQWRSFNNKLRTTESKGFVDGDLIECFLELSRSTREEISQGMDVQVEELTTRVEELARLH